jgi:hypothetical protein
MLRHLVLMAFSDEATPEQRAAVAPALRALPPVVPSIRSYWVGEDAGLAEGNWDLAVVADFDDEDGWRSYTGHPEHVKVLTEVIRPILARRAAVQSAV